MSRAAHGSAGNRGHSGGEKMAVRYSLAGRPQSPCLASARSDSMVGKDRPLKAAPHGAICIQIVFSSVYW